MKHIIINLITLAFMTALSMAMGISVILAFAGGMAG